MVRKSPAVRLEELAGLQYVGLSGISMSCHHAVKRLVQYDDRIERALILTSEGHHALLLTLDSDEQVAVKAGFSSGYNGEGPRTLAEVLRLLRALNVDIEECDVPAGLLERLEASALTTRDVDDIARAPLVRPQRWHDYIHDVLPPGTSKPSVWRGFRPVMPWAIIDGRIVDLALRFFDHPDDSILTGFRRLEDTLRTRTGLDEHGARLFAQAFAGDDAKLEWKVKDKAEQVGRAQLFAAAFMAYRNPRAHRELDDDACTMLAEFLMLNQLFRLEAQAANRKAPAKAKQP